MRPLLCYVTDRTALAESARLKEQIERAITAEIDWIQIREKDLAFRAEARRYRKAMGKTELLDQRRYVYALAAKAHGMHLRKSSAPVAAVNAWRRSAILQNELLRGFLIGASCHSLDTARAAERDGADYVIFGPVFPTPSKEKFGAPQGIKLLEDVSNALKIPVLAVGGITEENARECFSAGASGIAAIRMFSESHNLAALVERLRAAG
jgi:thiamine-phosphate pyrophosphorylase